MNEAASTGARVTAPPEDALLVQALEEYAAALQAGARPDKRAFEVRYPEIAATLAECLEGLELVQALVPQLDPSTAGAAAATTTDFRAEVPIGDYRIIRELGRGGMGIVFEAMQLSLGRRVALKVLPFAAALDARQLQRFKNEAQAAAQLHHTNIVPIYAVGQERGVHYYAMQYIDGQTLADVIVELRDARARHGDKETRRQGDRNRGSEPVSEGDATTAYESTPKISPASEAVSLSPGLLVSLSTLFQTVARLGIQAAEALEYAHQLGVVHRDIKPANLLVDPRGKLWIADFGLAHCQSQMGLTMSGDLVGTLRYMSPEQALAKRVLVDHRTDIYSLGVTLYELLTLQYAFPGTDRHELLRRITFDEPRSPRRVSRSIPAELETIVLKAMAKNPTERYATAQELADDLDHFLKDEPIRARRPSLVQRARRFARRHRSIVWSATVCSFLLALALAGSIGWISRDRVQRQTQAADGVEMAMGEARSLHAHGRLPEAQAVAQRAKALLPGAGDDRQLRQRYQQLNADLQMLEQLDDARLQQAAVKTDGFDTDAADPLYAAAFRDYELPVLSLESEEAARCIAASAIARELIAALDHWAACTRSDAVRVQCQVVARLAESDPRGQQIRDALTRDDKPILLRMAEQPEVLEQPPSTLGTLANALAGFDLPAATTLLRRAQLQHPSDFWINHQLAYYLTMLRPPQLAEAVGYYRAALALRPTSTGVYVNLGHALDEFGARSEAIRAYRHAVRCKPDYASAHYNLGTALRDDGDLDGAIPELREALRLNPNHARAHNNLGVALGSNRQLEEATVELRIATRLKPKSSMVHSNLGNALHLQGRLEEALAECQEAVRLEPTNAGAHHNLGNILGDTQRPKEAMTEYREAVRLNPENLGARQSLGNALRNQGQLDDAIAEYREILRRSPSNYRDRNNLATALSATGRFDEAIAEYREVIRQQPHEAGPHNNLGEALKAKGLIDDAIAEYREALRLKPDLLEARHGLGHALHVKGRDEEAMAEYREIIRRNPRDGRAHYNVGNLLSAKKQLDEAIQAYQEAIRVRPEYAEAHCNLGLALQEKGRFREGLVALRKGHELGCRDPRWPYRSAEWIQECERLLEQDGKPPANDQPDKKP